MLGEHKNKISEVVVVPSSGGVFEISIDGKLLFSKAELGRFPEDGEAEDLIRDNL